MAGKNKELFSASDLKPRRKVVDNPPPMPLDITGDVRQLADYAEIPCDKLRSYRRKDPHDIVDKDDPEYQALVVSITEKGVYDAIIVRPITDDPMDGEHIFEILEGHHRVEASRDAGKMTVPAKIIRDCSDNEAEDIYRITNLLRKKHSIRDLAYGWWHYFQATRYKSQEEVEEMISSGKISKSYNIISESKGNKQLRRYARLHELTEKMMELVEKKNMSIKFAEQISFIDKSLQDDLADYKTNLKSLEKAKQLRALAEGKLEGQQWCKASLEAILFPHPLPSENTDKHNDKTFISTLQQYIPMEYHEEDKMLELIQEALALYFDVNSPEKSK